MAITKVSRTFPVRLDFELNKAFNAICVRHGDVSYHLEQALLAYKPIKKAMGDKTIAVKRSQGFVPPTPQEAGNYFLERGSMDAVNEADKFIDFYTSKGWVVGKNKMKDWKSAVRNWMRGSNEKNQRDNRPTAKQRIGDAIHGATANDW